jgi:hypothetical protein
MRKDEDGYYVIWKLHPDDIKAIIEDEALEVELDESQMLDVVELFKRRFHSLCETWDEILRDAILEVAKEKT